ncbi:MAG: dihydrolipoamide acetyltransferase family protein [Rhodobacter sp.]|nr:dihydrolipoamide acetyltransferase family protein [Rhodobacter sp.]
MNTLPVKLPDVGEGVTQAELVEWHVDVGDLVREDDVIAAVMTDKATVEIPSLYDGRIAERTGEIGDILAIGTDLVRIETDAVGAEDPAAQQAATASVETSITAEEPVVSEPALAPTTTAHTATRPPRAENAPVLAAPFVRARARRAGVDLRRVPGSGPAGRIKDSDLDAFLAQGPAAQTSRRGKRQGTEDIKVVGLRRKIAERMSLANARIAHITVVEEIDVTALEDLRGKLNETRGEKPKLTVLPLVSAALCRALADHPEMNAHYDDGAGIVHRHAPVHIGIATMTEAGLTVPVLRHAEALGLFDTAREIARLSDAARNGTAGREDLAGSTITITSLGPLGAIATTPIINHPEVAILGVNKMEIRPHWDGTQFVPRKKMNLSASFDHRVIDGWDAAVFVQKMKTLLETPALIFVEG